ncbi:MAG TPA: winged helix-turn-helix domain-containing protein [Candidatus Acidoferrum sp.]|nr:winged helix-turn-helix domain-containing protein [Candidatus Acidoferrum sp.]
MRKLVIADADVMQLALQQEILRSEEARYDHRLHGVLLLTHGLSCYAVAGLLGQDPRTVERWVQRFETHGFAGLHEGERSGRPRRLEPAQWAALNRELRRQPRVFGYPQNLWDGKLLAHHLRQVHGVTLGVRQCQRLFRQLGFRRRKPRPLIAQADPAAQAAFKKTPPARPRRRG